MILVAIGANLQSPVHGSPLSTCKAVLPELEKSGLIVTGISKWYESAPVPVSSQPWYVNGVIAVDTSVSAHNVLSILLAIEANFGRVRGVRNAARTLDLDLIAYNDLILNDKSSEPPLILPHPRLHERAFVLRPLADIAPDWRHPETRQTIEQLITNLKDPMSALPIRS